jgi:hypothetical protein
MRCNFLYPLGHGRTLKLRNIVCTDIYNLELFSEKKISYIVDYEIMGPGSLKSMHDAYFIYIKEQVCGERDIFGTHWKINCLLKTTSTKHTN